MSAIPYTKMDTLYKILDILLDTMGVDQVKEHCEKKSQSQSQSQDVEDVDELVEQVKTLTLNNNLPHSLAAPVDELTTALANLSVKEKKQEGIRCDARIYGDKLEIPGTKSPKGTPYVCYKPAQCDRKASMRIPTEDDGSLYLCKLCFKRYTAREEMPVNWHGFFDDDGAPATSHFVNGAWHRKKAANVKAAE